MSDILQHLETEPTGMRVPVKGRVSIAELSEREGEYVGTVADHLFQKEYRLSANIGVNFVCNEVELPFVRAKARRELIRILYEDFLSGLNRAQRAILAGDFGKAEDEIDRLRGVALGADAE